MNAGRHTELRAVVDEYIRRVRPHARTEMDEFSSLPSLKDAIRHASLCHFLPSLKRHPHQYRIPQSVLQLAERKLQRAGSQLAGADNFERLYDLVDRAIGSMGGIGALAVYDISHRIGAHLGKSPKLVYLHRGTRTGARHLGFTGDTLGLRLLPTEFSRLMPAEIEDCLCIYADLLTPARLRVEPSLRLRCLGLPRRRAAHCARS